MYCRELCLAPMGAGTVVMLPHALNLAGTPRICVAPMEPRAETPEQLLCFHKLIKSPGRINTLAGEVFVSSDGLLTSGDQQLHRDLS